VLIWLQRSLGLALCTINPIPIWTHCCKRVTASILILFDLDYISAYSRCAFRRYVVPVTRLNSYHINKSQTCRLFEGVNPETSLFPLPVLVLGAWCYVQRRPLFLVANSFYSHIGAPPPLLTLDGNRLIIPFRASPVLVVDYPYEWK
jgi:hypothetical protein